MGILAGRKLTRWDICFPVLEGIEEISAKIGWLVQSLSGAVEGHDVPPPYAFTYSISRGGLIRLDAL